MLNNQLINKYKFDEEEKIILNSLAIDNDKKDCLSQVLFASAVSDDDDIRNIMNVLANKIEKLTDDEWSNIQLHLPFELTISYEDYMA